MSWNAKFERQFGVVGIISSAVIGLVISGCTVMQPVNAPVVDNNAELEEGIDQELVAELDQELLEIDDTLEADSVSEETAENVVNSVEPAQVVRSIGNELPGIEVLTHDEYDKLVIHTSSSNPDYNAFRLDNPDRVVIDIFKEEGSNTTFDTQAAFLEKVRIGDHGDKSRIVIDVTSSSQEVGHNVSTSQEGIVVVLAPASSIDNAVAMANTIGADSSVPQFADETVMAKPSDSLLEGEFSQVNNDGSEPMLEDLLIEQQSSTSNMLVAQMGAAGFYSFEKTAPSEYVLTLEKTAMSPGAQKILIAPQGTGKIRSVRPVVSGEDVQLRIFADPTTLLKVKTRGNKLIIGAYDEMEGGQIMAQADLTEEGELNLDAGDEAATDVVTGDADDEEFDIEEALTDKKYTGRLISLDLQDTDIDNALRIIAEVSNLNIIASDDVTGKVTLRLIDVPWDQALDVILKTNGLDKVQEGNVVRIAPVEKLRSEREALKQAQQAEEELETLKVNYIRVSYARAADLQALVETVVTERGTVTYDERTNQLIVKDIEKGLKNVAKLVEKLDLRTPQVLIETQIVEASRTFVRELGSELGFHYIRSPSTGNATPYNFPNSVQVGGSAQDADGNVLPGTVATYPAGNATTALSFLFGSADGTKALNLRLSQGETEGLVKVISRPSVSVTNNSPAVIKSVEKIRIKLPQGGTGTIINQGDGEAGGGNTATETIEVGIVLNVTAQASPDYYVLLDLDAKSSSLGPRERGVDDIPPEIERSATSAVLVSSGQTFAMGGIYRISEDDSITGTPFIKDIPFIGQLFRRTLVADSDQELIFFITPRIIEGSFDDAAMKSVS